MMICRVTTVRVLLAALVTLVVSPATILAQGGLGLPQVRPGPSHQVPVIPDGPLVVTLQQDGKPVRGGLYRVCAGTAQDWQAYGIATAANGEASFPDAPHIGEVHIAVYGTDGISRGRVMGAVTTQQIFPTRRNVIVELAPNPATAARCSGVPQRPDSSVSGPRVTGTLSSSGQTQSSGPPWTFQRNLTLFTRKDPPTNTGVVEASGNPVEFRTREDGGPFGEWRRPVVAPSFISNVTHQITGSYGRKSITVQLRDSERRESPEYTVEVVFVADMSLKCAIQYHRADNANAPYGMPQGSLGWEEMRLIGGETRRLDTAWPSPNEKSRGYGMHLRITTNTGQNPVRLTVRRFGLAESLTLAPGEERTFQHDLVSVHCP